MVLDGHHAIAQRLHSPISSGLPPYDAPQHSFDNASLTPSTAPVPLGESFSQTSSFISQLPSSISKYTMSSLSGGPSSHESHVAVRY